MWRLVIGKQNAHHQKQALILDWVQNVEGTSGSSKINMSNVIQFRIEKDEIKIK